jgi:hypothetical protein
MKKAILLTATMLMCASCGGQKNKTATAPEGQYTADSVLIYVPPVANVPSMISDPAEQLRWVAQHYWDNFQFADTLAVDRWSKYAEQAFVDMCSAVMRNNTPPEIAAEFTAELMKKAAVNRAAFDRFIEIASKYLNGANSPLLNEDMYIGALRAILANPALDEWDRIWPQGQLDMALKNRPGDRAIDFKYTLASGASGTLHGLKARYTLLFFNNPGCPTCRQFMDEISATPLLVDMIAAGTLRVLAVYTDADLAAWREYLPSMPKGWICAYDPGEVVKNNDLYDLKMIPTLYLLDSEKRVILKDELMIQRIAQTLYNDANN